jgi:hypothetical protein
MSWLAEKLLLPVDLLTDAGHQLWLGSSGQVPKGEVLYADTSAVACAASVGDDRFNIAEVKQAQALPRANPAAVVRIVCVSDTHERHQCVDVPDGDVFVHAGDLLTINRHFTADYSLQKLACCAEWMRSLPHAHKIFVAGNHDAVIEKLGKARVRQIFHGCHYLEDEALTVTTAGGLRLSVYGSPYSHGTSANRAFQSDPEARLAAMPSAVDLLITHAPLRTRDFHRLKPHLHVCGHIHCRYGVVCSADGRHVTVGAINRQHSINRMRGV